jgi:restriction endonuclease S subunit
MNYHFKLKDVVKIRSGMVVAKTSNNDERLLTDAFVRMIGTSDFDEDLNLRNDLEPNVLYKESISRNFLQTNEILFNAKGNRFFAYLFQGEYENTIASAVFLVLTLIDDKINPAYLTWYLNHPETLKIFNSKKTSQTIPSVTKQELGELEIPIPDLSTQEKIVQIDQLKRQRTQIKKKLIASQEALIDTLTYKTIKCGN